MDLNPKHHLIRAKNIDAIKQMHLAGICHGVIAQFFCSEGIKIQQSDISSIIASTDKLSETSIADKKVQALIDAKRMSREDEALPCALN